MHNETKIETIQNLKIDYEINLKTLLPTIFEQEKSFEKLKTVLDKKETEFKEYRSDLDSLLEKRFREQRKFGENKSLFDREKALLEDKREEIKKLKNIISKIDQSNMEFIEKDKQIKNSKGKNLKRRLITIKIDQLILIINWQN